MTTLLQPKSMVLTVHDLRLHYLDWGTAMEPVVLATLEGFLGGPK